MLDRVSSATLGRICAVQEEEYASHSNSVNRDL